MELERFYQELLGLKWPWPVRRVELKREESRVEVWLEHEGGVKFRCPGCGKEHSVYDHGEERRWRHLDSCACETYVHARLPRVKCGGEIRQVVAPWTEGTSRFTLAMERRCIEVLLESSVSGTERLTGIGWHSLWLVMERAVERGRKRKGQRLPEYMDMWDPYIAAVKKYWADAEEKIVFDRFHVMRQVTTAVDGVRKQEHRELQEEGDDRLSKTKYLWLWNEEHIPERRRPEFEELRRQQLKVGRAWSIKESLRALWEQPTLRKAGNFFRRWYFWATHSRLQPMIKASKTLKNYLSGILNYVRHGITNACSEAINSKIECIKKMACGYRNRNHYKTAIYFHCGGLNLYPKLEGA